MKLAVVSFSKQVALGFEAFADRQIRLLADAARHGADLVLLPDGAADGLRGRDGADPAMDPRGHLAQLQHLREPWLQLHRRLAGVHAMAIVAGAFPVADGSGRHRLRTDLFLPDSRHHWQDRLHFTAAEADSRLYSHGTDLNVLQIGTACVGIAPGHDGEYPLPVHAQCQAGASLLLMPVHAVDDCGAAAARIAAQSRALENGCVVAQSVMGAADETHPSRRVRYGGAVVIDPADPDTLFVPARHSTSGDVQWHVVDIDLDAVAGKAADPQRQRNWASQYFPSVRQPRRFGTALAARAA